MQQLLSTIWNVISTFQGRFKNLIPKKQKQVFFTALILQNTEDLIFRNYLADAENSTRNKYGF